MNIIIYLTCILLAVHCLHKGIDMSLATRKAVILSYSVFFGGLAGIAVWTLMYGANLVIAILLTGMSMVVLFDKRQVARKRYLNG